MTGPNPFRTGAANVLRDGSGGPTGKGARRYDYGTAGVGGDPAEEDGAWLGTSVPMPGFGHDGRAELVATAHEAGRPHLLPGTSPGPSGSGPFPLTPTRLGLGTRPFLPGQPAD
ncbi:MULTISPECIES: hypothetical protein [unclassified Streptomyces]|uniref:hypothetical protein n=1 Tax=unclassified Streptomyces TaxID=2593676 RepID=UPI0036FC6BF4